MFLNAQGKPILLKMIRAIQENKDFLSEVDGLIGDGDHGANMNKGFTVFDERFRNDSYSFTEGLSNLSMVLMNEIGGSMGPIYGMIFSGMAEASASAEQITLSTFGEMLKAGLNNLYDIVDARAGDKTLVDTLAPASEAIDRALDAGKSMEEALNDMADSAREGWQSTKDMVAKYGRSSRLGERSRGVLDAGATSCYIILNAMAQGIKELL